MFVSDTFCSPGLLASKLDLCGMIKIKQFPIAPNALTKCMTKLISHLRAFYIRDL